MKNFAVTAAVMAASDRACIDGGVPSVELMLRAARAIASHVPLGKKIYVFCGKGNNGGDGYACAHILKRRGQDVTVFALSDELTADAAYYRNMLERDFCGSVRPVAECDYLFGVAVDCIFGTGFKGEPRGVYADVIDKINAAGGFVVAADIASGLDGTSGIAVKAVKADVTVAVQTFKTGHFLNDGKDFSGKVFAEDIGIEIKGTKYPIFDADDVARLFPPRRNNTNKGSYGKCAIVGGCDRYVGAVKLASMGATALRAGAGLCVLCVPRCIYGEVAAATVECTMFPMPDGDGALVADKSALDEALKGCVCVAVGMGMGAHKRENLAILAHVFYKKIKVVVDADGLNALCDDPTLLDRAEADVLLTPHPGEFARLTQKTVAEVLADPVALAEKFASDHRCTVLLKGATTFVTDGHRGALITNGSPAQSKGGSGDVLSGTIAGIAACGNGVFDCACAATYLCAEAAKRAADVYGQQGVLASDVAKEIKRLSARG